MGEQHIFTAPPSREEEINSVVEILDSRYVAERVVADLGPAYILGHPVTTSQPDTSAKDASTPTELSTQIFGALGTVVNRLKYLRDMGPVLDSERAIIRLIKNLRVDAVKDASIVRLGYDASDPASAQRILGAVVEAFLEHHARLHRTPGSAEFLVEQASEAKKQLKVVEQQLANLKCQETVASTEDE